MRFAQLTHDLPFCPYCHHQRDVGKYHYIPITYGSFCVIVTYWTGFKAVVLVLAIYSDHSSVAIITLNTYITYKYRFCYHHPYRHRVIVSVRLFLLLNVFVVHISHVRICARCSEIKQHNTQRNYVKLIACVERLKRHLFSLEFDGSCEHQKKKLLYSHSVSVTF